MPAKTILDELCGEEWTERWKARAIYLNQQVDLLHDRQWGENVSKDFLKWLNKTAIPWLCKEVKERFLAGDSEEVLEFTEGEYTLKATPNRSHGYLYIGAVRKVEVCEVCEHSAAEVGPLSSNAQHDHICDDCIDDSKAD